MPEYENVTVVRDGRPVVERRELPPFIGVRVTTATGHSWETSIRGTIEEARRYFMQCGGMVDIGPIGHEKMDRIVSVEQID